MWTNLEQPIDAWTKIHITNKNNLICTVSNCAWLGRQGGKVHANYTAPTLSFPKTTECIKNISILSDICRIATSIHLYRPSFTLPSLFTARCISYPFPGALSLYPLQNLKRWNMYYHKWWWWRFFIWWFQKSIAYQTGLLIILIGQENNYIVTINIWNHSCANLKTNQSLQARQVSIRASQITG